MKPLRSLLPASFVFSNSRNHLPLACTASLALFAASASASVISRLDNANTLDTVDAWSGGVVPVITDVAQWTDTVTGTGSAATLAANVSFGQLLMQNTTAINIGAGGGTLTLGAVSGVGIDMTAAAANLTIASPLSVSGAGQWNIASGRNLAVTGVISGTAPNLTLSGLGTVTLNKTETFTTPTFSVNGGTLALDESGLAGAHVLPTSGSILGLGGGTVSLTSPGSITSQPAINTLSLTAGASTVQMTRGGSGRIAWSSTNFNRSAGATVLFTGNDGGNSARFRLPTTANVPSGAAAGSVIPWATFTGSTTAGGSTSGNSLTDTWAVAKTTSNDMIGYPIASYTASTAGTLGTSAQNSNVTTDVALASGGTVNTIRFNDPTSRTVTITSGTLTIGSGGVLVGTGLAAGTAKITGGTLMGGTPSGGSGNDLIVIQNDTNANGVFEIDSIIADNITTTALTKSGPGVLVLGGANTFTGGIYLNQGSLRLTTGGSLGGNAVTFTNNSSAALVLGGVNTSVSALKTSAVPAATAASVQNVSANPAVLTVDTAATSTFVGNLLNGTLPDTSPAAALGLTKAGAGTLALNGTNTYTGPTTVSNGTLGVKNTIDSSSVINVVSPGVLDVTTGGLTPASGGTLTGSGSVLGTVTANSGVNLTPGAAGTVGTLTVGSLNLNNGSNLNLDLLSGGTSDSLNVTGALTLGSGEVIGVNLSGTGIGSTGTTFTIATAGSVANFTPSSFAVASGSVGGLTYTFASTGTSITLTISGVPAQNSTWALSTGGSWTSPSSNWSPSVVPNGASQTANFGSTIGAASTIALNGGKTVGTLTFNSPNVYTLATGTGGSLVFNNGISVANLVDNSVPANPALPGQVIAANVTLNSNTLATVAGGETLAISGTISGAGDLAKSGAGVLNLAAANSYGGSTTLNAGTLNFVNGALSSGDFNFVGGTLQYAVGNTQDISDFRNVTISGPATVDTNGNDVAWLNSVGSYGNGGLTKTGSGKLSLENFNTYAGGNVISAGILSIAQDGSLGLAPASPAINVTIQNGAILQTSAAAVAMAPSRNLLLNGGTATIDTQANDLTIQGSVAGAGILKKIGSGNLALNGTGTYASTVLDTGTLVVGSNTALGSGSVTLNGTSILNLGTRNLANGLVVNGSNGLLSGDGGGVSGIGAVTGSGNLNVTIATGNMDLRGSLTGFVGTIANATTGSFRFNGSTGGSNLTLDLGTSTGGTMVRSTATGVTLGALAGGAGTILTGSGGSGSTQAVTYTIGAKTVGGLGVIPVDSTFDGIITNGASTTGITKTGLSTLTLNGLSTCTGATTVNAGTLRINGAIGSAITVNTGGTLGGGTTATPGATGALTVNAGGSVSPGTGGIGILNVGNTAISGTYACDISGVDSDKLVITGTLNITNANLVITGTPTANSYVIATYTGALTGSAFASVSPALPSGYVVTVDTANKQILIQKGGFENWIASYFPGETNPAIIGKTADPDGDGMNNITEFALDGNPASGASTGKVVGKIASVGGVPTQVLTLPVRVGAVFTAPGSPANGEQVSTIVDAVSYKIQDSADIASWILGVSEVTGTDKSTIETGLPALSGAQWSYRTFQGPGPVSGNPKSFLRAAVISQP